MSADCCRPFLSHRSRAFAQMIGWALICLVASASAGETSDLQKPVAGKRLTHFELAAQIDRLIAKELEAKKLPLSPIANDAEFLRRVFIDIAGTIPPLERVEAYFADTRTDKRAQVIDELLRSPEYVRHMTDQWREHLIPNTAAAARRRHETGLLWLEQAFRDNLPFDQFVRGVLTADGMQRDNGATTFLLTHQSLDEVTDRLSRVLLGVQITCAQCHNHPFADWRQEDYWGIAAFFSKVRHQYERINNVEHYGVSERGDRKPLMTPPSLKVVPPTFLGGVQPSLDKQQPFLPVFVDWLASPDNPYFSRAFANRLWRKLMGRGLIEPVDDLRDANPGTHPELLAMLGEQFRLNGFDIHYLLRAITLSDAYQRTSRSLDDNRDDLESYSHMSIKVLSPYVLGDSIQTVMRIGDGPITSSQLTEKKDAPPLSPDEQLKASIRARGSRDSFANFFKSEENASPLAYEVGVPQALRLMNAQEMQRGSRVVAALSKQHGERSIVIEKLYWAILCRSPTETERQMVARYVESQSDGNKALADIVWALLNSTEFATNH